jgi:hypothetical protein
VARVAVGVALEVVLVLGLCLPERSGGRHLGDDLARPQTRGVDIGDRVLCDAALLLVDVVDRRAIARPDVVALAVLRRRVVNLKEELQQVPIGDALRVEQDLDRLRMRAVVPLGRVGRLAAGVANTRAGHTIELTDQILDTPEAPARQNRLLACSHLSAPPRHGPVVALNIW